MGKVIKFQSGKKEDKQENSVNTNRVKTFGLTDFETQLRKVLEDYIKSVFAVKEILGMDIVFKEHQNTVGVIGVISYEHKRRPGTFVANFIGHVFKGPNNLSVREVAFETGEPELYKTILLTLKAKKALPEVLS